ncbi:SAM-dependent methyltransferase [Pseudofrankia sp. BMG5.37]|uniref:SAM-dependent methyltransferase n=1 Tax=Pseudofrankia sp. BMG5.37 TaxID=3050035 RepID=UPI002894D348|nr:SAM-dependent methyltransferase [Pseudofrankia sp. BMG5.37]MDT3440973.1 SAM-dependent methyltransferase [Pseudofrankia sp. BMG5.37]
MTWDFVGVGIDDQADQVVDVRHAQTARVYDYLLGGKNNYGADQVAAQQALGVVPHLRTSARENRAFLHRAVRFAAGAGVDQFLDVGTGIPTEPNLHQIAQGVNPAARVVYVDHDPLVLVHARALLTGSPEGRTAFVDADLRSPQAILSSAAVGTTLDLSRPVGLSLVAVLHFVPDSDDPASIVADLVAAAPKGSLLVLSHGTGDFAPERTRLGVEAYRKAGITVQVRSRDEVAALVPAGLEILDPGIVPVHRWRPDTDPDQYKDEEIGIYGLVGRKL